MARASGLTTGLTIRYLKKGDNLDGDNSIGNGFDGWSTTDSSDLGPNSSWSTPGNGLISNFEQNLTAPDVALNADTAATASDITSSAPTISSVSAAVAVPASSPLHYFLKVDGVTGDSTIKGFEGWFAVDGYDLGIQNTASIGSAGGGAGAGKAAFSPLTVDIHSLSGLTSLFGDVATGHALKSVELVGVESIKDQNIKVYDVKLSDVLLSGFENDPSAKGVETALTFNFAKIQLTDQPVARNGTLGTPQTFAFDLNELKTDAAVATSDVAANAATTTDSGAIAAASASAAIPVQVPAASPLHYFLKVDGVTGDSTIKGFEGWFAVDGYDLGIQNSASIGSAGGGAGAGKAQFSPLTVDMHSLAGLTSLFGDVATGHALKSVELVGVESIKDQNIKVYDVKLSDVLVNSFENDPSAKGVETALSFNFAKIQLTDQPVASNGTLGIPQTFAFDLNELKTDAAVATSDITASAATTVASTAATTSAASAAVAVPTSSPLHYFLKVDGVTGDSTIKGFEGWFAVDGYDLGIQNSASIGSAGGGAGAGKAHFSPLTIDIHSLSGLTSLFGDVATGHALKSVELVGVESIKDQNIKVYDVKLSDVLVSSFENDPGAKGVETALTFNFAKIQFTDQPVTRNGTPGIPQTFAFDLNQLKTDAAVAATDVTASAATAAASTTATTSAASAAVAVPTSSPLHYFLKVDGVTGDSTIKGFEGWIAVDGYDLGVHNTASIGSAGGGAGAGKAQFSPLTVDMHSLAGLTSLFGDVATGRALKSVELVGVESIKDQNIKVYDVKLSDVLVSSFENDPSAKGVETALSFNFAKIQLTDQPAARNGTLGTPQTFAFDLNELKTDAAVATSDITASAATAAASTTATTSAASAAVAVPTSSPLHYFLKVDGVTGDSTIKGFEGWFAVDGYDLGVHNTTSIGSAGGGAGAGRAQFSPLTVDIHSLAGLTSLFGDVATGRALKSVELVGVESIKDQNIKVYDAKLSDVLVSSLENDPSAKGVETALTFNFAKIQLTDQPVTRNGTLGTPQTFAFDLNELKTDAGAAASDVTASAATTVASAAATTSAASAAVAVPASSPLHYFLKVDGVTGDSTIKGFEGWFAVDGYDIGVHNAASIGSAGGGAGAGRAQFSPLTVDIHSLSGLTSLFGDVATGHALKSVELVGVETLKDQSIKAYDLKLSDVLVSSFENDPSAKGVETALSFNYSKISLTNQPLTADGSFGTPQTFAFDLNELKTDAAAATSDVATSAQVNSMALALANFMASSTLGPAGSQELASTASPQQDSQLQTLAAHA